MEFIGQIRDALREVKDPELGLSIIDLGLVYDIKFENKTAAIIMTLTSPGCPVGPMIVDDIHFALERFPEIDKVNIDIVWSPPWNPSMMTEEAKDQMGIF
jgi:metal-sulfur cluster biosynthetic enzyme